MQTLPAMHNFYKNIQAVILDAGQFPTSPKALCWLDAGLPVVCCDGAAERFLLSGRVPWRIVGDSDSLKPELQERYKAIVRHIPDQETNDQTKAVEYLASYGYRKIAIVGATGLREDHTLGNITLLQDYLEAGVEARIFTDYGVFVPVDSFLDFKCRPGTKVSIFNFGASGFRSEGLQYPLYDFKRLWQGTLNVAVSEHVYIEACGQFLVFVEYGRQGD